MPAEHTERSPTAPQTGPASAPLASMPVAESARDRVPEVLLTVLGMSQAPALELAWSRLEHAGDFRGGGIEARIGWLQMGGVLQGILLVWILYASPTPAARYGASRPMGAAPGAPHPTAPTPRDG